MEFFSIDFLIRIGAALALGFILGLERELTNKYAGLRTHILVCLGACTFTIISIYGFPSYATGDNVLVDQATGIRDTGRVAAQVVSGIGFIGAGAILHQGLNIRGLTSAAIIWTAAALGLAIGAGFIVPALITFLVAIISLIVIEKIEEKIFPADAIKKLSLVFYNCKVDYIKLEEAILAEGMSVKNFDIRENLKTQELELNYIVKSASNVDIEKLIKNISKLGDLEKYSFELK